MSRYCPYKDGPALYTECVECDEKICSGWFFCMIIGSRSFVDYKFFKEKVDHLLQNVQPQVVIVSGGARGTDSMAEVYAKEKQFPFLLFPSDWKKYGNKAGYTRNRQMHEYISKQERRGVVAFWGGKSKGTAQSFSLAKEFGNPIRIIRIIKR